jgi:hypothetical protein
MKLRDVFRPPFDLSIVWLLLPFTLIGGGLALMPLRSWDYWWHIAFGRVISATHEMPLYNHFLYTLPAEAPSYVQAWLSQWALYELHELLGLHGILILRNTVGAIAFTILGLWAAKRADSAPVGGILGCIGAVFGFFCVAARTHLLAWPLYLLVLPLAYAVRKRRWPTAALALLPLISVGWANLHGTFLVPTLVGLAFTGAAVADRVFGRTPYGENETKRLLAWVGATATSFGATFLNPRGAEIYLYLVDLPTNPENLATVTEWFPTTLSFPPFYGAFFWILLVATLVAMGRKRDEIDFADLFILVGFSLLAIRHSRALLWFGLSIPIVAAPYVRGLGRVFDRDDEEESTASQAISLVMAGALVVLPVLLQPWNPDDPLAAQVQPVPTHLEPPFRGLVPADTPVEPALMLRVVEEPRIFHDYRYPGFLLYVLQDETPSQMVWVDNRIELPPPEIWRAYDRISRGEGWREAFAKFDVNAVVASTQNQQGLIDALRQSDDWSVEFENEAYALFVRRDS